MIGFASGDIPAVPLNQILLRNRSVIGIDWGIWAMTHPAEQRALLGDLLDMVAAGTLDLVRPTAYPLEDVASALEDLLGRRTVGKTRWSPKGPSPTAQTEGRTSRRSTAARGATS